MSAAIHTMSARTLKADSKCGSIPAALRTLREFPANPRLGRTFALLSAGLLALFPTGGRAQVATGNPAAGQHLAEIHCIACHAMEGSAAAGQRAPPFAAIARMPSTTSMSLHAFLMTPHPTMPNLRLTPEEIDDAVAYILSLRQR